jgi:hypothetical protein
MNRRHFVQLVTGLSVGTVFPVCGMTSSSSGENRHPKRGLCLGTRANPDWREKLQLANTAWFYNWTSTTPAELPPDVEFVPMLWRGKPGASFNKLGAQLRKAGYKELLGFNEPDQAKQGNMTVDAALDL